MRWEADPDVRFAILRAQPRPFCAGARPQRTRAGADTVAASCRSTARIPVSSMARVSQGPDRPINARRGHRRLELALACESLICSERGCDFGRYAWARRDSAGLGPVAKTLSRNHRLYRAKELSLTAISSARRRSNGACQSGESFGDAYTYLSCRARRARNIPPRLSQRRSRQ